MIHQTNTAVTDVADRAPDRASASQVSVGNSSAALLLAANATRRAALVVNHDSSIVVYVGFTSGVTSSTGIKLSAGQSIQIPYTGAIYAIAASSTVTCSASEVYD